METPRDTVIVIFGAAGDLAKAKLLPAFYRLWRDGLMPARWHVVGTGRTERSDDEFRELASRAVAASEGATPRMEEFARHLSYVAADFGPQRTRSVEEAVERRRAEVGDSPQVIVYLSTPPSTYHAIAAGLVQSRLAEGGRVVFEKPFGRNRADAAALARTVRSGFDDGQVFLIDHFLGKEAVQGLLSVRFANGLLEPVWNRHHVDHVRIDVLEDGDVGSRGDFFEETGTIRDMLATHLLHVVGFVAMDPPPHLAADAISTEVEKVFAGIAPMRPADTVRGQYEGYRTTDGVAADSDVETFVATRIAIRNHRWDGVPFLLRTGKALHVKRSTVTVVFKAPPAEMFPHAGGGAALDPNRLTLDLDRPGCLSLGMLTKEPGWDLGLEASRLSLETGADDDHVGPYDRLLHDALLGDRTLFSSIDALDRAWEVVEPVLTQPPDLQFYPAGSAGPVRDDAVIASTERSGQAGHGVTDDRRRFRGHDRGKNSANTTRTGRMTMSEGKRDELAGKAKEALGKLRGDEEQEREGEKQQVEGKLSQAGDKVGDAVDDVKDAVTK